MPRTKSVMASCNEGATGGIKGATVDSKESSSGYGWEKMQQPKLLLQVGERDILQVGIKKDATPATERLLSGGVAPFFVEVATPKAKSIDVATSWLL